MTGTEVPPVPHCPFANGQPYDPMSGAAAEDAEPWLRQARARTPVFYHEPLDVYVLTRHADIMGVLRDPRTYSSRHTNRFKPMTSPALKAAFPNGHPGLRAMTLSDPPVHTRIRRLANVALTPRAVSAAEPRMVARCHQLIDAVAGEGTADLMACFSAPMTVLMITDLAGLPETMELDLHAWAQDYFALNYGAPDLDAEQERAIAARSVVMMDFLTAFVEERRTSPREDLISDLVHAHTPEGDAALTTDEVIGVLNSLLVAGVETTAVFVPMFLRMLLRHPEQWRAVFDDRTLLPGAIEEGLRHQPTARGVRRTTMREVEIAGVRIPEGQDIFLAYASANYDHEVFPEPDRFDLHRPRADRHLTFGKGTHFCIGAPLARQQTRVAVEAVMDRLPDLRVLEEQIEWRAHMTLPRPTRVRFAWDPA